MKNESDAIVRLDLNASIESGNLLKNSPTARSWFIILYLHELSMQKISGTLLKTEARTNESIQFFSYCLLPLARTCLVHKVCLNEKLLSGSRPTLFSRMKSKEKQSLLTSQMFEISFKVFVKYIEKVNFVNTHFLTAMLVFLYTCTHIMYLLVPTYANMKYS